MLHCSLAQKQESSGQPSPIVIVLLVIYNIGLVIRSFSQHDGFNLLFYSLVPDMISGLALSVEVALLS